VYQTQNKFFSTNNSKKKLGDTSNILSLNISKIDMKKQVYNKPLYEITEKSYRKSMVIIQDILPIVKEENQNLLKL